MTKIQLSIFFYLDTKFAIQKFVNFLQSTEAILLEKLVL